MVSLDRVTRAELAASGDLFDTGYELRMARVHARNAQRLRRVIESVGWPGTDLVGPDGAEAAWLILQHAIAEPDLLRSASPLLETAAREGRADPAHAAMLEDRIRFFEGQPQLGQPMRILHLASSDAVAHSMIQSPTRARWSGYRPDSCRNTRSHAPRNPRWPSRQSRPAATGQGTVTRVTRPVPRYVTSSGRIRSGRANGMFASNEAGRTPTIVATPSSSRSVSSMTSSGRRSGSASSRSRGARPRARRTRCLRG